MNAAPHPIDTPGALEAALWIEFARLNAAFFEDALQLDCLIASTRKRYGGYCVPSKRKIVVSWHAFLDHGWDELLITFRHEVAHLVHPNHTRAFWELAERIGCPPDRRKALPPKHRDAGWWRFLYECPGCGQRVPRRTRLQGASCGRCDKRYNPNYRLKLIDTLR